MKNFCALALVSQCIGAASPAVAQPRITNIPRLYNQHFVIPTGVSADGRTVIGGTGFGLGMYWNAQQGTRDLGNLPGGAGSRGFGVSADGSVIVGTGTIGGFRYTQTGGAAYLFNPTRPSSALGVSADGGITVGALSFNSQTRGYRLSGAGELDILPVVPGGINSFAVAVSADGSTVVGYGSVNSRSLAYRWTQAEGLSMLGVLPGGQASTATAISGDGGTIVGRSGVTLTGDRAFRWTSRDGMQALGVLSGDTISEALGVNFTGSAIVGRSTTANDADKAFLWTASGGLVNLNTYLPTLGINLAGWNLTSAVGISADGNTIVGIGTFSGQRSGWLATIPSPGAGCIMGFGALLVARRRRR